MRSLSIVLTFGLALSFGCGKKWVPDPTGGNGGTDQGTKMEDMSGDSGPKAPDDMGPPTPTPDMQPTDMKLPPDMAPSDCKYPSGPYGKDKKGDVINPDIQLDCYVPNSDTTRKMSMRDLIDCDGTKGFNAFMIETGAIWCGVCQDEVASLAAKWNGGWKDLGIMPIVLVEQNAGHGPSTLADAKMWRDTYKLSFTYVCSEPTGALHRTGDPTNHAVDPRTMKVVEILDGYDDDSDSAVKQFHQVLEDTAKKNKK